MMVQMSTRAEGASCPRGSLNSRAWGAATSAALCTVPGRGRSLLRALQSLTIEGTSQRRSGFYERVLTLKERALRPPGKRIDAFHALNDVSFEVRQ